MCAWCCASPLSPLPYIEIFKDLNVYRYGFKLYQYNRGTILRNENKMLAYWYAIGITLVWDDSKQDLACA